MNLSESLANALGERKALLEIFPTEVWMQILDGVHDPDALFQCSKASSFLKELLEPIRTVYLFPQVLKVLVHENHWDQSQCLDFLNFRLVCNNWKVAVTQLFESLPLETNLHYDKPHQNVFLDLSYSICFRLYRMGLCQLEEMISSPFFQQNNPFPSRYLEILEGRLFNTLAFEWNGYGAFIPYRALTEQFLQKAGHHFWYAQIVAGFNMTHLEWYTLVRKYIQLMPNLRALYITCPVVLDQSQMDQLNPAPPFPALKYLEILSVFHVPKCAMNAMFNANKQIKSLIIPELRYADDDIQQVSLDLAAINNPNPVSIALRLPTDLNTLPSNWNLKALHMDFTHCFEFLDWSVVFRKLEELYSETLTDLYLCLPRPMTEEDNVVAWDASKNLLNLPKLKSFKVVSQCHCALNFLLGLTSLERLALHLPYHDAPPESREGSGEGVVHFESMFNGMDCCVRDCNIWNLIPTLERIELLSLSLYNSGPTRILRRDKPNLILKS